jgi:nucleoid-associated protein YgaU
VFFDESRYLAVREYTVIDPQGRTVRVKRTRATLNLSGSFQYTVKDGDRPDLLSHQFYQTPRKWWLICDANPDIMYPDEMLVPGRILIIPPNQGT